MSVSAPGFVALRDGFLQSRESPNTRAAYARDLASLADALGIAGDGEAGPGFGVEEDPEARAAARQLSALPAEFWTGWRDALPGRLSSRRRRVAGVRAFCRWWSRLFALENPVADLRPPAGEREQRSVGHEIVALPQSEARAMCEAARRMAGPLGARTWALVEVLYGCGLRASELVGLDLSACHLDDARDPYVVVRGKGSRQRAVAIPRGALEALAAYLSAARPELRARDRAPRAEQSRHRDADAVFLNARGRRLTRGSVWRIVRQVAEAAGLAHEDRRVFPHALRHSCGTHLIQSGIDIRYVQAHLGHASPVTTEVYTHVTAAHLKDDFDRAHPRSRRAR
jgi:integrase/recombinase XerD